MHSAPSKQTLALRYGCNPHQQPASIELPEPSPLRVISGEPSYINLLDALSAWQLVRELKAATGRASAASFKHMSPAGAAIDGPLSAGFLRSQFLSSAPLSPVARAYVRARGGDRMSSYGDAVGVSEVVDASLAGFLRREVSDVIIAPGYGPEALEVLRRKKKGAYVVLAIDPDYEPPAMEARVVFGLELRQRRNDAVVSARDFENVVTRETGVTDAVLQTLVVASIALKYTQSNSICIAHDGQLIGVGAGQQSRVHCARLACDKADKWFLQQHPRVLDLSFRPGLGRSGKANIVDSFLLWEQLSEPERAAMVRELERGPAPLDATERAAWIARFDGVCMVSDAYIPFRDSIDRAQRSNVRFVAQTGASVRDDEVRTAADEYGMVMFHCGRRSFTH
ncbi:MAG: phosphoribosylaminoimidazolecarboxamide formyltransferase [Myxococcales bacterium]|nr:phosphoribosylaminoimidazolecarboxamide formyltransferase [Myxococcales bacterium]